MVQFLCFDKLFSALDRKVEGFLKLTDCVHNGTEMCITVRVIGDYCSKSDL